MRNLGRAFIGLSLVAFLASPALGQPGRGFGGFGGPAALLQNQGVQEELKLTDEQKTKVQEAGTKINEFRREKMQGLTREDFQNREKMAEINAAVNAESEKLLAGILNSEQEKRLNQIRTQQQGVRAFTTEEVQKALNLTDAQKEKIQAISTEYEEAVRGISFRDRDAATKRAEKRTEAMGKIAATLTAEQKKTWKDLTGEPFEVRFEFRRPGGTRPGGRPQPQPRNDL